MERSFHIPPDSIVLSAEQPLVEYSAMLAANSACAGKPEEALWPHADIEAELALAKETLGTVANVILVGIGGSSLAAEAVAGLLAPRTPHGTLTVLDTLNPFALAQAKETVARDPQTAIVIASKSGETMETLMNAECLLSSVPAEMSKRVIVLSDVSSPISHKARERDILAIGVPANISGRMSAFTATALVPLALLGYDTSAFLKGGASGRAAATEAGSTTIAAALTWAALFDKGIRVREIVAADPTFYHLARFYRQLLSESLGKEGKGWVPDVTIATTDYHSVLQLRLGGPRHTASTFVYAATDPSMDHRCAPDAPVLGGGAFVGKSFSQVRDAIRKGIFESYEKHFVPFEEIVLPSVSEEAIGHAMAVAIAEVMYLGKLWNINAFNQDAVEDYKITAKGALSA